MFASNTCWSRFVNFPVQIEADRGTFRISLDADTYARAVELADLFGLDVDTFVATIIKAIHADEVDDGRLPERDTDGARPD